MKDLQKNKAACPYCESPLATPKARQCLVCGWDWHDPDNPVQRGDPNGHILLDTLPRDADCNETSHLEVRLRTLAQVFGSNFSGDSLATPMEAIPCKICGELVDPIGMQPHLDRHATRWWEVPCAIVLVGFLVTGLFLVVGACLFGGQW